VEAGLVAAVYSGGGGFVDKGGKAGFEKGVYEVRKPLPKTPQGDY
jgi:hypothetical protein